MNWRKTNTELEREWNGYSRDEFSDIRHDYQLMEEEFDGYIYKQIASLSETMNGSVEKFYSSRAIIVDKKVVIEIRRDEPIIRDVVKAIQEGKEYIPTYTLHLDWENLCGVFRFKNKEELDIIIKIIKNEKGR